LLKYKPSDFLVKKRQFLLDLQPDELDPGGINPALTPRQQTEEIQKDKDQVPELKGIPTTSFIPNTKGAGIFGVGLLSPRAPVPSPYETAGVSPKNIPILVQPQTFSYFFIEYPNVQIARGIEGEMVSFAVILTLSPVTLQECSEMLRLPARKITPLSLNQYLKDSFNHPTYLNDNNQPLQFRYAEVPILRQKTPGRLDNIPLSYPDFDNTPDGVITRQGPIPAAPYTEFATATGATGSITISAGGTVDFVSTTPVTPWQFAPTGFAWNFGATASPTGATSNSVVVTYGQTGSYTVTLTTSNATGSTTLTKTNFVIVT
jgi:hypothetical protein